MSRSQERGVLAAFHELSPARVQPKRIEVPMPRYFFHLKADAGTVVDDEGLFLHDIDRARFEILQILDEILSERDFDQVDMCGHSLEIADETGETVLSINL